MQRRTSTFSFRALRHAAARAGVLHAAVLAAAALCCGAPARADTLVVPGDFDTIQGAVDAAESGDNIVVEPGTYTENLELVGNVEVRGRETARTLIRPDDGEVATVTVANASGARLANVTLIDAAIGVSVTGSSGVDVSNVVFDGMSDTGLSADAASSVEVTNNVFFENATAINRGSTNVQVENNIFARNTTTTATVLLPGADPLANILSNCFFANDDTQEGDPELGVGATFGDPLFVDSANRDFHLREDSACIDAGRGTDAIDSSTADAGAYGGPFADPLPFPVGAPALSDASTTVPPAVSIAVTWSPNLSYRVTSSTSPGGYRVHYKQGGEPEPPFEGTDAGGGTLPSPIDVGNVTTYTLENLTPQAATTPLAPRLLTASGRNQSAILTWEAAASATGYRVHYGVDSVGENVVEAGDTTSFTVTGLGNETTYRFAVSAINQPAYHVAVTAVDNTPNRNESAITAASTIAIGTALESPLSAELTATPGAVEPFPDLPDEGCFIATAAYGADWAAEVRVLRAFRDRFLLTHPPGRWLVRLYYTHGPVAAAYLNEHDALKPPVRAALLPLVALALLLLHPTPPAATLLLLLFLRRRTARVPGGWPYGESAFSGRARARGRVRSALVVFPLTLLLAWPHAALAEEPAAKFSPRWMYELKGGYFYPELEDYDVFYGDDRDTAAAVSGSYRVRDWLEVGAEIGHMRDEGVGIATGSGDPGAEVTLRLVPLHVFANFIYQPDPERRFVPYGGVGLSATWYEQDIELQEGRDGRTDVGPALRAGIRWFLTSDGPRTPEAATPETTYWRSYVFLEAQKVETEIDDIDLGGTSYLLGFRIEFELGR